MKTANTCLTTNVSIELAYEDAREMILNYIFDPNLSEKQKSLVEMLKGSDPEFGDLFEKLFSFIKENKFRSKLQYQKFIKSEQDSFQHAYTAKNFYQKSGKRETKKHHQMIYE